MFNRSGIRSGFSGPVLALCALLTPTSLVVAADIQVRTPASDALVCPVSVLGTNVAALASSVGTTETMSAPPDWTVGEKRVLFIRVNYPNDLTDPQSAFSCGQMMEQVKAFIEQNSYGQTHLVTTITPLLTLPKLKSAYATNLTLIYADALAVAQANGYDYLDYDLDIVRYQGGPGVFSGQGLFGTRKLWLKQSQARVVAHELGHNFGLLHANAWQTADGTVVGAGVDVEYGDPWDTMGIGNQQMYPYQAFERAKLGWIPEDEHTHVTFSGVYRIYAFDDSNHVPGLRYALAVPRDHERDYWLDFRSKIPQYSLQNGVELHWAPRDHSVFAPSVSQLLDTTPDSSQGIYDGAVLIGRTFSDPFRPIHITPVAKGGGGATPSWLDVVVNVVDGDFDANRPPTGTVSAAETDIPVAQKTIFTADASDPDADALAFSWDFGDGAPPQAMNAKIVERGFTARGEYRVRCTISDMRGGIVTSGVTVRVGSPITFSATGTIREDGHNGNSEELIEGVLVTARDVVSGITRTAYTESDGTYRLTGLGNNRTYALTATKFPFTIAVPNGASNPLLVKENLTGIDFVAERIVVSLRGHVFGWRGGGPVEGVLVSDGTRSAETDEDGNFEIQGVPGDSYSLTATKDGYRIDPSGFTNPVLAGGDADLFFEAVLD